MTNRTEISYKFGPFIVDTANYCLLKNGIIAPLGPKPFKVLLFLIQNKHRTVSQEELIEMFDPDTQYYGSSMIAKNISYVRRALGDSRTNSTYIKTIQRFGYRFIAPVEVVSGPELDQQGSDHGEE